VEDHGNRFSHAFSRGFREEAAKVIYGLSVDLKRFSDVGRLHENQSIR
jgi:hypothetical protein